MIEDVWGAASNDIGDLGSGVPWPVLVVVVLLFGVIQYVGPKIVDRWRTDAEDRLSYGQSEQARYEGAARFIDATGEYGVRILEQLSKVQAELEDERNERWRLERRLARAFGVLGILEEEINVFREREGQPPISERLRKIFPDLYDEKLASHLDAVAVKMASQDASRVVHHDETGEMETGQY